MIIGVGFLSSGFFLLLVCLSASALRDIAINSGRDLQEETEYYGPEYKQLDWVASVGIFCGYAALIIGFTLILADVRQLLSH